MPLAVQTVPAPSSVACPEPPKLFPNATLLVFAVETPLPAAKATLRGLAATLTPATRAGDYAQAAMDLGATLCTPRKPACSLCPLTEPSAARQAGTAEYYPAKRAKPARPLKRGVAFWAMRQDGAVLYPIIDRIPVLLVDEAIPLEQLPTAERPAGS